MRRTPAEWRILIGDIQRLRIVRGVSLTEACRRHGVSMGAIKMAACRLGISMAVGGKRSENMTLQAARVNAARRKQTGAQRRA